MISVLRLQTTLQAKKIVTSGASRVFRRSIIDSFDALEPTCPTEDTPFLLRGLYLGEGMIINHPGIYYRIHGSSLSAPANLVKMKHERIKKTISSRYGESNKVRPYIRYGHKVSE